MSDGIEWELSTPYNPQQSGGSERSGRIITDMGRTALYEAGLPEFLWPEFVTAITYIVNRIPIHSLDGKSPFECLYGQKPYGDHIKILGSLTYVLLTPHERKDVGKFDPQALKGYLIGFKASNIYRVWILVTNRVIRARDIKIDEIKRY